MNGVTGRMGTNQHLLRSILAIRAQGGVATIDGQVVMPDPILVGRSAQRLLALSEAYGGLRWTTDLGAALANEEDEVFFDASITKERPRFIEDAVHAGKAIYCEKPTAESFDQAMALAELCERAGLRNGVVQDKLWLPGIVRLRRLIEQGFFGRILSIRGEFGYWVFTGHDANQQPQRPSWNYRRSDGGSIILDMFCHWEYLIRDLFGPIRSLVAIGRTEVPTRVDENGREFACTADDAAYAIFRIDGGVICQFNSSWTTRVRRDDLLTIHVDGSAGSAVAGLRDCVIQTRERTPRPVWNPDVPQSIDFNRGWVRFDPDAEFENAFKKQWELFLRHVAADEAFPWTLRSGARGVQLAERAFESWRRRAWVPVGA